MESMTFTGRFLEKIQRSADSASYLFSRPSEYRFKAGQFVSVTIPAAEGTLEHHFSHADSPTEDRTEITTRLTGSAYKNALDSLTPGTEATFRGPAGDFVLRDEPKIVFLTGGIGITAVRSMIRYLYDTRARGESGPHRQVVLLYGSKTEDGIIYRDELDEFARGLELLRVVHVLSEPGAAWSGRTGFITADLVQKELSDPSEWLFYIDGPPPMVAAMRQVTDQLGLPRERVIRENFVGYDS